MKAPDLVMGINRDFYCLLSAGEEAELLSLHINSIIKTY